MNVKVIYAGVSQEVRKLIEVDDSLRTRLSDQMIIQAKDEEIKQIITRGWDDVEMEWDDIQLSNIVK